MNVNSEWGRELVDWLIAPSVVGWIGAVAAIVAALATSPKTWLRSPATILIRAFSTAVIWLIVAWALGMAIQKSGQPSAEQGGGANVVQPDRTPEARLIPPDEFPADDENVVLVIQFVPSSADAGVAQDFACDLVYKSPESLQKIEIRADDMTQFETSLVAQLRGLTLADVDRPTAKIPRTPFPGNGILQKVRQKVLRVFPDVSVEAGD